MVHVVACTVLLALLADAAAHPATPQTAGSASLFPPPVAAPQRLPPVDEFDISSDPNADNWEALPLELEEDDTGDSLDDPASRKRSTGGGMGGPFGGGGGSPIGYRFFGEPTRPIDGQPGNFEHWGQEIRLAFPAWTADPHVVMLSTGIANDLYDTHAVFPRSGLEFPESLWNIRLGTNYVRTLSNDWKFAAGLNIGSASDRPFAAIRDINPAVFTFLRIPRANENAWNLSVFYSPLSEIPFPIPGVAYYWHASEKLQMNIGLPAQVTYQPTDWFTFTASYMLLHTVNARGTWQLDENWSAYLAYENRNRAWFLHDRQRDDERLFAYDQAVLVGLERTFLEKFKAELAAGYLFNRFYFIGEDYADRNRDRIDIDPGATISAQLGIAW